MHALQCRNLRKRYGKGESAVDALAGVSIDIPRGEFISIMGASGSGKSTLMHLMGLLDTPTSGAIRVMGETASSMNKNQRAAVRSRQLGFVFQAFHLIPRASALQNVMLPMTLAGMPRRLRLRKATELLHRVGLGDRIKNRPNQLSGGQKQRVAIARALALDPPILLADEPTGNLDTRSGKEVMDLFTRLHRSGKTVVQVTHDPDKARYSQRIVNFRDGLIIDDRRLHARK